MSRTSNRRLFRVLAGVVKPAYRLAARLRWTGEEHLPAEGGFVWGPLYRAMALAGLGHAEQARAEVEQVRGMRPETVDDPAAFLSSQMNLAPEQLDRLVALVRSASGAAAGSPGSGRA